AARIEPDDTRLSIDLPPRERQYLGPDAPARVVGKLDRRSQWRRQMLQDRGELIRLDERLPRVVLAQALHDGHGEDRSRLPLQRKRTPQDRSFPVDRKPA